MGDLGEVVAEAVTSGLEAKPKETQGQTATAGALGVAGEFQAIA